MTLNIWRGEGAVRGYHEKFHIPMPENKDLAAYIAYSMWCNNPHENVHAEITQKGQHGNPDGLTMTVIHLPKLTDESWAMETLVERETMRDELFIGAWMNQ